MHKKAQLRPPAGTLRALRDFSLLLLLGACDLPAGQSDDDAAAGGGSHGQASEADVDRCENACDKLKLFECIDSSVHETCFEACHSAPASEIDRFYSCVESSSCDATCIDPLQDSGNNDGAGESAGDDEDSAGDGEVPSETCVDRCEAKAVACQAPAEIAAGACASICDGSVTSEQLDCLEGSTCEELAGLVEGQSVCGLGESSSGGGGGGDDGGGDDGGNGTGGSGMIGSSCACSGDPDAQFESCSGTTGPCGPDLTCYVTFGEGICSTPCEATPDDTCPVGECTIQIVQGAEVGQWCVP